jgi:hypothetical protein
MINQRYCPFCKTPAMQGCEHLALAVEAREFVRRCVEASHGDEPWRQICHRMPGQSVAATNWSAQKEDFMWLETAFCERFLRHLKAFGGLEYEWRTGPRLDQGGFWALLWSGNPRQLWWELKEELERQNLMLAVQPVEDAPWLIQLPR